MLSLANTYLSFYLLFVLCIAGLAASAPTTHQPFPYGKLADKILNVNDRKYDASYMIDNFDTVRVYPEGQSMPISSGLPIASFEPKLPLSIDSNNTPNVSTNNNVASRTPNIIKKVGVHAWGPTLIRWCTLARDHWKLL